MSQEKNINTSTVGKVYYPKKYVYRDKFETYKEQTNIRIIKLEKKIHLFSLYIVASTILLFTLLIICL
jgi:hypothetical protein